MKLKFKLDYRTQYGENLVLNQITGNDQVVEHAMRTTDGRTWKCELELATKPLTIDYYYSVVRDGQVVRHEWTVVPHRLDLASSKGQKQTAYDHWYDMPEDSYLYSSALTDCVARRERNALAETSYSMTVQFKVRAPQLRTGERLAVVGSGALLGDWDIRQAVPMTEHNYNEWVVALDVVKLRSQFIEFKFVILSDNTPGIWENGDNRTVVLPSMRAGDVVTYELQQAYFAMGPVKIAGTVVPIFSLRSEHSFGVGDFGDLKRMIDWVAMTGQRALQVLPINDSTITHTWQDSYPYNSISIYALHPQYCDLNQLPPLADKTRADYYETLRCELNALPQIDYERVNEAKLSYLREIFAQEGAETLRSDEFKAFFKANKDWLVPYAAFCHYRDLYGTACFNDWPDHHTLEEHEIAAMSNGRTRIYKEVSFWYFVQFCLDRQMHGAHEYARSKQVILKGDIPIGISRDGVEAWVEPRYFNLNGQAGAPPDAFSVNGQNWGFPTYNWEEMAKDNYAWWKARMGKMAQYFDAFRIDHILGFFRIWEIPSQYKSGLMGHFNPALPYAEQELRDMGFDPRAGEGTDVLFVEDPRKQGYFHPRITGQKTAQYGYLPQWLKDRYNQLYNDFFWRRHNDFWRESAMRKLPALLRSTGMLACGEDLGMIPGCVPSVMDELNILSLEIQRMPKDPKDTFGYPGGYPYWCVCATGTHDTSPLRAWWEEDRGLTQRYYNEVLGCEGDAPYFCEPWVVDQIIAQHMHSPAMLAILPLQDWLAMDGEVRYPGNPSDERINVPAIPRYYWRYRMHCTLESLEANDALNAHIKAQIAAGGRGR